MTKRREVLYALRALSMAARREVNNKIPWSGVTDASWKARGGFGHRSAAAEHHMVIPRQ